MTIHSSTRLLAIGLEPPPLGGVTVFFSRWVSRERQGGTHVKIIEYRHFGKFCIRMLISALGRYDEVFINSLSARLIILTRILHPRARISVVDHNASRRLGDLGSLIQGLRMAALTLADRILLVSDHLRQNYSLLSGRFEVISSFVPPDEGERDAILNTYSARARGMLRSCSGPKLIISAWRPILEGGKDLYGLEDALNLLEHLLPRLPGVKLVAFVGEPLENELWARIRARTADPELRDHVHIEVGNKELWPALSYADVALRMTATDGNSVSVHEALWAGCQVVASDVVPRPAAAQVYRYGRFDELVKQVVIAIDEGRRSL